VEWKVESADGGGRVVVEEEADMVVWRGRAEADWAFLLKEGRSWPWKDACQGRRRPSDRTRLPAKR
jgi:hypothetical protein